MRTRHVVIAAALALALMAGGTWPIFSTDVEAQAGKNQQRSVLLDTVTTGTGQIDASSFSQLTFYLSSVGTTSGGVVSIEEADWDPRSGSPYTGTWSVITTVNASSFTGGAQIAYHVQAPSSFGFVRARVSSTITGGGTATVVLRMQ